jgi:hypothetical protein
MTIPLWFTKRDSTRFIVKNIAPNNKTIKVFNYPILNQQTRDLLAIPGVSEADIRHDLLKGEVMIKIKHKELLVVDSNIDLLQFDDEQKQFLIDAGVNDGYEITGTDGYGGGNFPYSFRQHQQLIGIANGVNRVFMTSEKFINGIENDQEFHILITHNGKGLEENIDYTVSESVFGTGYDTIYFVSFIPNSRSRLLANYVIKQ